MRKLFSTILFLTIVYNGFSQSVLRSKNYDSEPNIDATSNGIWSEMDTIYADSTYVTHKSTLDYGDLRADDLELKVKSLWYDKKVYFLLRQYDDKLVNGKKPDGSIDESVADGLDNLDATTFYFYFSSDTFRLSKKPYAALIDTIAWMRFVWESDTMEAVKPGGDTVHSFEDFSAEMIQWKDATYKWAKFSIDLVNLVPHITTIDSTLFGFEIEMTENDKEVGVAPYATQTKAYWGSDVGENALEAVYLWSWIRFVNTTFHFNPVRDVQQSIASIFPNPVVDQLTIRLNNYDRVNYSFFDMSGRVVLSNSFEGLEETLDMYEFDQGVYFLQLFNSEGVSALHKVLVVR